MYAVQAARVGCPRQLLSLHVPPEFLQAANISRHPRSWTTTGERGETEPYEGLRSTSSVFRLLSEGAQGGHYVKARTVRPGRLQA